MHNPTTGTLTANDFDKLRKIAKPPKSCAPVSLSTYCFDLLPCSNHANHSTYHIDNCCCSSKCNFSHSKSCRCLRNSDHHDDDRNGHQSSLCIDSNYAVHNNVHPSVKFYLDITVHNLVGLPSKPFEILSNPSEPDYSAWHTNPDNNPYRPVHFDSNGNGKNTDTATYSATYPDYESNETSYIANNPQQICLLLLKFVITLS